MESLLSRPKWLLLIICVCVISLCAHAQVTNYIAPLGIPGIRIDAVLALDGGDLFAAGKRNGELHLSRWNNEGDTLWTRGHDIPVLPMPMGLLDAPDLRLTRLSTGEILLTTFSECHLLNDAGDVLSSLGSGGLDVSEHGVDSLIICTPQSLKMVDRGGVEYWSTPLVYPAGLDQGCSNSVVSIGGRVLVSSASGAFSPMPDVWHSIIQLGWYDLAGALIDTMEVFRAMAPVNSAICFRYMSNGDVLGLATMGTGMPMFMRFDPSGDTLWVRKWEMDQLQDGPSMFDARDILETSDGRIVVAGVGLFFTQPEMTLNFGLLELDDQGYPICYEALTSALPPPFSASGALVSDAFGQPHMNYTFVPAESPHYSTMAGIGVLCEPTVGLEIALSSCGTVHPRADGWQLDRAECLGDALYTIHDALGREVASGVSRSGSERITIPTSPSGVYILRVTDIAGGGSISVRSMRY
jgi:hypothetical protein